MSEEKKKLADEQLQDAQVACEGEELNEDELDAVAGGGMLLSIGLNKENENTPKKPYLGIYAT